MSQFYARYVPPSKPPPPTENSVDGPQKRKRDDKTDISRNSKKAKKSREQLNDAGARQTRNEEPPVVLPVRQTSNDNATNILDKYRISEFVKKQNGETEVTYRKGAPKSRNEDRHEEVNREQEKSSKGSRKADDNVEDNDGLEGQKHANVMSKFGKAKRRVAMQGKESADDEEKDQEDEKHGLEPIPQPEPEAPAETKLAYSTLPPWQSNATVLDHSSRKAFRDMNLSKETLANLERHNIVNTFPVQSAVIPMLLDNSTSSNGDICVSAATGSGKTLAYILPIIEAVKRRRKGGLRAVIVVPTRELVKQVRETCDICASGSSVRIVTTVGSKSLKDEQDTLVEREMIYDPAEYERQQSAPVDWTTFDMEKTFEYVQSEEYRSGIGFVATTKLKVDVLITTPGRLVDHLKNTPGFHLDDVEWLVVDEADRLLSESYQEWVETVIPALQSRGSTKIQDEIWSYMHMDLPPRRVRKILLSATMTQDISKLNALGLQDPRLVVLRSSTLLARETHANSTELLGEHEDDSNSNFHLPATLQESAIVFKNSTDKPLALLQLLNEKTSGSIPSASKDTESESETSSDESSDSDGDSDSDISTSSGSTSSSDSSSSSSSDEATSERMDFVPRKSIGPQPSRTNTTPRALIFARSTASASRLSRLLSLLSPTLAPKISTLTRSTASSSQSRQALSSFRTGKTNILIATDRASRGIDVPNLEHVINYDIPGSALTYVHRVGRTARAGKEGHAWTLVEHREGRWFWSEIGGKADDCKIKRTKKVEKIDLKIVDEVLQNRYETALEALGEEVKGP